jgi:tetratricopeptide (TPR) repeat protein
VHFSPRHQRFERARQERGDENRARREELLAQAIEHLDAALVYDPEHAAAHYNLKQIYDELGDQEAADRHAALHAKYKPDDNARDRAVAAARRRYPAANHAAEAVVVYDLRRDGAFELATDATKKQ